MTNKKQLKNILLRKARGYYAKEITEDYSSVDGEMVLQKKKITTKHIPPDVTALKAVAELDVEDNLKDMTDSELAAEKTRLLKLLDEMDGKEKE